MVVGMITDEDNETISSCVTTLRNRPCKERLSGMAIRAAAVVNVRPIGTICGTCCVRLNDEAIRTPCQTVNVLEAAPTRTRRITAICVCRGIASSRNIVKPFRRISATSACFAAICRVDWNACEGDDGDE